MSQKWNERYAAKEYAYGEAPNNFFKEQIEKVPIGKILLPAEGEGRNAVYAAQLGWEVYAFDQSIEGKHKALRLAEKKNMKIVYDVAEFNASSYPDNYFDLIALIYAHFPSHVKSEYHKKLTQYLKSNGIVIFEAFSKKHLEYREKSPEVGGPENLEMLFSLDEIKSDFHNFEIILLEERSIQLSEGEFHKGEGSVIRFVGRKL